MISRLRPPADPAPPSPASAPRRIRDLVGVRPHPTVVRLGDLERDDAGWITAAYHLTPAIQGHLDALRSTLRQERGRGAFLVGQFGSGKSHFLAYLTASLRQGTFVPGPNPDVAAVSLLDHRGSTALEDVVARALGVPDAPDRGAAYERLAARWPRGMVLVLDELSEFLRSKPDARTFTEDVRFLQFLGEQAQAQRLWIVASMQEQIEHTGDLDHGLYRKIKDRFPLRLLLTPTHVRDLVAEAILQKAPGYRAAVANVVADVRRALPAAPVRDEELEALYPLHPATLELLEEVRDRLSQTRGIVDFVVTRLRGDPARGVDAFLDAPWGDLLTPDVVVDHFRDLFELHAEFAPLAQQCLPWYERHLPELFDRPAKVALAQQLLKLLVLVHLSPAREGLTAGDATCWLLYRPSRLDAARNVAVVQGVLDTLATHGRFVARDGERFRLVLEDDDAPRCERQLAREVQELSAAGDGVFEALVPLLEGCDFDPFTLPPNEVQSRSVRWHFHTRRYDVYLGSGDPPPRGIDAARGNDAPLLCVRLPWGERAAVPGAHTLVPRALAREPRHVELAALARLRDQSWSARTKARIEARVAEGSRAFAAELRSAFLEATLLDATGAAVAAAQPDLQRQGFERWLERQAERVLQRLYPSFERFAPSHGPLPRELLVRFVRAGLDGALAEPDADEAVKLVREAYLVPMGLLARQGRGYVVPKQIERNELVRLLLPLLDHHPSPVTVHEHLAQPVYGLVPDQVRLLLLFLLLQGQIDVQKDGRSYRSGYELLPDPLRWERVVPGHTLPADASRDLDILCEGVGVKSPGTTVLAQRRAVERLSEHGSELGQRLQPLLVRLEGLPLAGGPGLPPLSGNDEGAPHTSGLLQHLRALLQPWRTLANALRQGDDPLAVFLAFRAAVGPPRPFLDRVAAARALPERLERLLGELQRLQHLLAHPARAVAEDAGVLVTLDAVGAPPPLEEIAALEAWLGDARRAYERYARHYREAHDVWWQQHAQDAVWEWRPPAIAQSRQVGAGGELEALARARGRAESLRCRGTPDLTFQPVCRCGFGVDDAPLPQAIAAFDRAKQTIEARLSAWFGEPQVRQQVRAWLDAGAGKATAGARAYLAGECAWPDVAAAELALLDRHLAGIAVVRTVRASDLAAVLGQGTLAKDDAERALRRFLDGVREPRLRFELEPHAPPPGTLSDDVVRWCLRQALRYGEPLPAALPPDALRRAAAALSPDEVRAPALLRLQELHLGRELERQVVQWLDEGRVPLPEPGNATQQPLVAAVLELHRPLHPRTPDDLAALVDRLLRAHALAAPVLGERWLARLDALANAELAAAPPPLTEVLRAHSAQWLLLDALGLPLLPALASVLDRGLAAWRVAERTFAQVSEETTTDACYRALLDAGLAQSLTKLDAIDTLVHESGADFEELRRRAVVELELGLRRLVPKLDPTRPLVVFADHGFRLARDGRSFKHGGRSTLERVVPVLRLEPR